MMIRMILKAVIMSLALVTGTSALHEMINENVNTSVSADIVATVVWDYLSQQNSDANVDQKAELTQKLKNIFKENMWLRFHDKVFPDEIEEMLVPFALDLYKSLTKDLERKKAEIQKELKDLQVEMEPHFQEVRQKIGDNAHQLQERLGPYSSVLKHSVDRMKFLNAEVMKCMKDLETGQSDNAESMQALVTSMPSKIKENITMNLLGFQMTLIAFKQDVKKTVNHSMKELNCSLAPFVKNIQKLDHQLEGLFFQLKNETLELVNNFSARVSELWKLLDPLPEAMLKVNMDELQKFLPELNKVVEEQVKTFQCKVSPYIDTFNKMMGQKIEDFGQKLSTRAGYMDDHLIFLEKDVKDKIKSFFNSLKNIHNTKKENVPHPPGTNTEPCPFEQNSANVG